MMDLGVPWVESRQHQAVGLGRKWIPWVHLQGRCSSHLVGSIPTDGVVLGLPVQLPPCWSHASSTLCRRTSNVSTKVSSYEVSLKRVQVEVETCSSLVCFQTCSSTGGWSLQQIPGLCFYPHPDTLSSSSLEGADHCTETTESLTGLGGKGN